MIRLQEKINSLPADRQILVERYVDSLLAESPSKKKGKPSFKWAGALKFLRDNFSSVELQKEASRFIAGRR